MGTIADRYRKNAAAFTAKVEHVDPDGWAAQSPCEDWSARDVVGHVVDTSCMFLRYIGREPELQHSVADDPLAAWSEARDAVQAALDDPSAARQEYEGMFGTAAFEDSVDQFLSADLTVHGWDLARATGQDDAMDPGEVALVHERLTGMPAHLQQAMRSPGGFGPELEAPPGADAQTRLLAFLGRPA
jgi:uncharacterized protein (TIGR03086 family)